MEIIQNNYTDLLNTVKEIISNAQVRISQSVNREKLEMCWEIGEMIDSHLLENDRAQYGENVFQKLNEDLGINVDTLYQMRNFYKEYPDSLPTSNLTWSHYRQLIAIKDLSQRQYFEELKYHP